MNSNDFRLFKDVQNDVEFVVRNADRKPVNMMGRSAKINLYDQRASKLLYQQDLKVINEAKGICKAIFAPDTMADWNLQTYSYSVQVMNTDGSIHMLYTDTWESQRGFFELAQGPIFDPRPSVEVTYDKLMTTEIYPEEGDTNIRVSRALPGSMQRDNTAGLHTVVAFLDNFTGELKIQGSVEDGSPGQWDWFDIEVNEFDHQTSVESYTFEANLMWVRFWVMNQYEQLEYNDLVLEADKGEITKLVFRN